MQPDADDAEHTTSPPSGHTPRPDRNRLTVIGGDNPGIASGDNSTNVHISPFDRGTTVALFSTLAVVLVAMVVVFALARPTSNQPITPHPGNPAAASSAGPSTRAPTASSETSPTAAMSAVELRLNDGSPQVPPSLTVVVNRPPAGGLRYWVLLRVTYRPDDVEFYGQAPLTAAPGDAQQVALQIPADADMSLPRTAVVWAAPAPVDKTLSAQQKQELEDRTPLFTRACPACDVAPPLAITP